MKRTFLWLFGLLMTVQVMAQNRTITGVVTDASNGEALIGVSVSGKGTSIGTVTDFDGVYSLSVPKDVTTLVFSYVGYSSVERAVTALKMDVKLVAEAENLDEFIVTALGISKSEKSLGYSATQLDGNKLTEVRNNSALDALSGKVAGLNIATNSGAPGASTKVVIRGYNSINGTSQPLYVVDGVPINNGSNNAVTLPGVNATTNANRTQDYGNQANDINPDDIETITVLKGSAASGLYGIRGRNGVILITTKKGAKGDKLKVDFSSSYTAMTVGRLPRMQNTFGQGWSGSFNIHENGSWGPKLDNQIRTWGSTVDNSQQLKPFSAQKDNLKDFFEVGHMLNESIGISGGTDKTTYRFSYSYAGADGILPSDADSYKRHTFGFNGKTEIGKFSIGSSINFVNKTASVITTGQGDDAGAGSTVFQDIIQIPRDMSIVDFRDYNNKFNNNDNYFTNYANNPYWAIYENGNKFNENRVYGNIESAVKITKSFSALWRIGGDFSSNNLKDWGAIAKITPGSYNGGGGDAVKNNIVGAVTEGFGTSRQLNSDLILTFNKDVANDWLNIDVLAGHGVNGIYSKNLRSNVTALTIPNYYDISNSANPVTTFTAINQARTMSVYGQATLGLKGIVYLGYQARNDWASTLPEQNRSFFYQGGNASLIVSAITKMPKQIDLIKLRANYGTTGNIPGAYQLSTVYNQSTATAGGFGAINFPFGGVNAFETGDQVANPELKPEFTKELEIGADVRLFGSRLNLDFAYYNKKTSDLIFATPVAASTGFTTKTVNLGIIQNKGFELLVDVVPVKTKNFQWDLQYVFTKNNNKVLELSEELGVKSVVINSAYDIEMRAEPGKPLGVFYGPTELTDSFGHIVVGTNGIPLDAPDKVEYGSIHPKYVMGLTNNLTWKGLKLSFAWDFRNGGLFYSYTSRLNYFVGNNIESTYNDRDLFVVPNSVQANGDGTYSENTTPVEHADYWSLYAATPYKSFQRNHVLDRTYLKLRDVSLSYTLPRAFTSKVKCDGITISAYGRNLLLWTPKDNTQVDPETTTFGTGLAGELGEFGNVPSSRNYGMSVKVSF
jgi:TonB-linked SusC/RagA family outer membrane protein